MMSVQSSKDLLNQRGLNPADDWGHQATPELDAYLDATIPTDYVSRVEALRCAIEWAREATVTRDQTIQRALDFHAFLMGRTQKEPVHTDE